MIEQLMFWRGRDKYEQERGRDKYEQETEEDVKANYCCEYSFYYN